MSDKVPAIRFDTSALALEDRLKAWSAMIPWFEIGRLDDDPDFGVSADAWLLGPMTLSVTLVPKVWLARPPHLIEADGRMDYSVVIADVPWSGRMGDGETIVVEAGAVCVLDHAQPFRVQTMGGQFTILDLSRSLLDDPSLPSDLHGKLLRNTLAMVFGDFMVGLRERLPSLAVAETPGLTKALRDLLVACLASGGEALGAAEGERALRNRAGRYVDDNLSAALTVADVARALGVSRSRLYRLFAEAGGVERFMMRRRLHRARAMLAEARPERALVADVAYATGFASTSHSVGRSRPSSAWPRRKPGACAATAPQRARSGTGRTRRGAFERGSAACQSIRK